jgi:predicted DCC family thiol-disulfide oxidoreductase YuxK
MKFAPLQGEFAREILARHPELRDIDSLMLVHGAGPNETVSAQSGAVAHILRYLGGGWAVAASVMLIIPGFARDAAYAAFAKLRYRIFGRYDACRLPTPEQRSRFFP